MGDGTKGGQLETVSSRREIHLTLLISQQLEMSKPQVCTDKKNWPFQIQVRWIPKVSLFPNTCIGAVFHLNKEAFFCCIGSL